MFEKIAPRSNIGSALNIAELIYHGAVRSVRNTHGNAIIAIAMNMLQAVMLVAVFYIMFTIMGLRSAAIRGDFLIYIMSGVFLFITHVRVMKAVIGADGPSSPMMKHAPMNTIISICSAALGALYVQILSLFLVLFIYHALFKPVEIYQPLNVLGMLMIAWFCGVAVGVLFLAIKPWAPNFTNIGSSLYMRANMIASGKMFVANTLPTFMLKMFDWNPLFHCIDQGRGFAFVNYFPRNSSVTYPIYVGIAILVIALMGEFYTRRHASLSWEARR